MPIFRRRPKGEVPDDGADREVQPFQPDPGAADAEAPEFRYHPDPLATGSAAVSDSRCSVCGEARGVVYDGPVYGRQPEVLCLVCIRTGQASAALAVAEEPAEFTDGWGAPPDVPAGVVQEVTQRTPGFTGWQQEHWLYHCGDAAAYQGRAGFEELRGLPDALEMVLHENDEYGWTADQSRDHVSALHRDGDATAYVFQCLTCGVHLAYTDMS